MSTENLRKSEGRKGPERKLRLPGRLESVLQEKKLTTWGAIAAFVGLKTSTLISFAETGGKSAPVWQRFAEALEVNELWLRGIDPPEEIEGVPLIVGSIGAAVGGDEMPFHIDGLRVMEVEDDSLAPQILRGQKVFIREAQVEDGDLVVFAHGGRWIARRYLRTEKGHQFAPVGPGHEVVVMKKLPRNLYRIEGHLYR